MLDSMLLIDFLLLRLYRIIFFKYYFNFLKYLEINEVIKNIIWMTYIWAEYIWLDSNNNYRSKTKIMENVRVMSLRETLADDNKPHDKVKVVNPSSNNNQCPSIEPSPLRSCFNLELYPDWNYDGSSTGQAEGRDSEVLVKPVKVVADPFRRGYNDYICVLVLCDTWLPNGEPHPNNTRVKCQEATDKANVEALFGLEQEFFLVKNGHPLSAAIQKKQVPKKSKNRQQT